MERLVLFCKSYSGDFSRAVNLSQSIQKYNQDNIPFYISVPRQDISLFKQIKGAHLVCDDEISPTNTSGWIQQQVVKSNFWKLGVAENYVCIDSDSYFVKPFFVQDFMYDRTTPYTVLHEQKELFTWTAYNQDNLGFNPQRSFKQDRHKIMQLFGRSGKYYDFGPSPTIWSAKVWESLEREYCIPNKLSFEDLIQFSQSEFTWYGEALLAFKSIQLYPAEPLFKVFHYPLQYMEYKRHNITEEMIAENYLGVVMQSNFNSPLRY